MMSICLPSADSLPSTDVSDVSLTVESVRVGDACVGAIAINGISAVQAQAAIDRTKVFMEFTPL